MQDGQHPIDVYIAHLARRLHLPDAERDQVLAEVRGHLEERARALDETGVSEEHAERQAVLAFGPVGRIGRELRASHAIGWGMRGWIAGMLTGAVVTYALWVVASLPATGYYFYSAVQSGAPPIPVEVWNLLVQSLQLGPATFYASFVNLHYMGWLYALYLVLPGVVLVGPYLVLPFVWGRGAQRWWVPGLAYGLGTCLLTVPELFIVAVSLMMVRVPITDSGVITSLAWMSAVALPLALAASFAGWWREQSTSALARTQAA
jgi:hypothetical protein